MSQSPIRSVHKESDYIGLQELKIVDNIIDDKNNGHLMTVLPNFQYLLLAKERNSREGKEGK